MESFRKFLGETYLHGFSYANDKNKFAVVFWATLLTICTSLAANDLYVLIQTYQGIPYQVGLSVEVNKNLTLPTPTLCMEVLVIPPTTPLLSTDIESDIKSFMDATDSGNNLNLYNSVEMSLSDNLEYLTYMMLGRITDSELLHIQPADQIYTDYAIKYLEVNLTIWSRTAFAYQTYMSYNVSLTNLKTLVGTSICRKQYANDQPNLQICQPNTLTHLSFSLVCSKLFDTETFQVEDMRTISMETTLSGSFENFYDKEGVRPPIQMPQMSKPWQGVPYSLPQYFEKNKDGGPSNYARYLWHLDLQGRSVFPKTTLEDVITLDPQIPVQKFDVSVDSEYNFYNAPGIRPCISDELQYHCQWRTLVERMSQKCNCWPSTVIDLPNISLMPTCSNDPSINPYRIDSSNSNNNTARCDADLNTEIDDSQCPKNCKTYLYTNVEMDAYRHVYLLNMLTFFANPEGKGSEFGGSFEVNFETESVRTVITEELSMTFTTLACTFGGIIGTWLGGSLLAFVHIPIFVLAQLHEYFSKRNKVENNDESDRKIHTVAKDVIYPPAVVEANHL